MSYGCELIRCMCVWFVSFLSFSSLYGWVTLFGTCQILSNYHSEHDQLMIIWLHMGFYYVKRSQCYWQIFCNS